MMLLEFFDEKAYRFFDALHVGVVILDSNDRIVLFNQMAGKMLGQDPSSRINSSILRCHPERAEPGVKKMIDQLKSGELKEYSGWVNFQHRIYWEHIYPIRNEKGDYLATVMELHDGSAKARLLELEGEFVKPELHGVGESSPRSPVPESELR